jgi:hypothetical protein
MYIKNRRNGNKLKAFGSYQGLCLTENLGFQSPTFHILTVRHKLKKENDRNSR